MEALKREEAQRRLQVTLDRKRKCLEEMEKCLRERYKSRTGEEPKYFSAL